MPSLLHSRFGAGGLPRCSPRKCACRSYKPFTTQNFQARTGDYTAEQGSNACYASDLGPWSTWVHPSEFDIKCNGMSRRSAVLHILGAGAAIGLGASLPERATAAIVDEEVATEVSVGLQQDGNDVNHVYTQCT